MKSVLIIPARYQSTRLPGKPLLDLNGKSMIERTYLQCTKCFPSDNIYVATDDERVKSHCESRGIQVIMTSSDCLTGTDRLAEVAQIIEADLYINVQGDEPLINPNDISLILAAAVKYKGAILNGYTSISDESDFRSTTIPKVVFRPDGRLLYMSRGAIPSNKNHGFQKAWRQVCIYGFTKQSLNDFSALNSKTLLERLEDIEILRFLELGYEVQMIEMSNQSVAVDTPEDADKVRTILKEIE